MGYGVNRVQVDVQTPEGRRLTPPAENKPPVQKDQKLNNFLQKQEAESRARAVLGLHAVHFVVGVQRLTVALHAPQGRRSSPHDTRP